MQGPRAPEAVALAVAASFICGGGQSEDLPSAQKAAGALSREGAGAADNARAEGRGSADAGTHGAEEDATVHDEEHSEFSEPDPANKATYVEEDATSENDGSSECSETVPAVCRAVVSILMEYMSQQREEGNELTEEGLAYWYLAELESVIKTEAQLVEQRYLVQWAINRMIKDGTIVEQHQSDNPMRPELRVLAMHPRFSIGSFQP